tara:strand:- start:544 stop:999 length:456 start_codon:yes stop_codon:yes gene_type:complete
MSFKLSSIKNGLKKYLEFIPFYLIGSGMAFIVDLTIFTLLRARIGTNNGAFISYIFGTFTSFSVLLIITKYKLNKKRIGLLIHLLIGLGTLMINLFILNTLDSFSQLINYSFYINYLNKSNYYAFFSKVISSCIGFIWTSYMTSKLLFKKK